MDCDNCEKPKVCPEDCGMYQDLEAYYIEQVEALQIKIKSLKENYYWLLNAYFKEGC